MKSISQVEENLQGHTGGWLNWSQPIEMLIFYQGYSGLVRGILLMEMKDLLLADCLVYTGFGGRALSETEVVNYRQCLLHPPMFLC